MVTGGLWLIIWLVVSINGGEKRKVITKPDTHHA